MDIAVLLSRDKTSWPRLDGYNKQYHWIIASQKDFTVLKQSLLVVLLSHLLYYEVTRNNQSIILYMECAGMETALRARARTRTHKCVCV